MGFVMPRLFISAETSPIHFPGPHECEDSFLEGFECFQPEPIRLSRPSPELLGVSGVCGSRRHWKHVPGLEGLAVRVDDTAVFDFPDGMDLVAVAGLIGPGETTNRFMDSEGALGPES